MLYGFSYGLASASERSRLKNEGRNIAGSYVNASNKPYSFVSHASSVRSHTDCLAALNGVCKIF